MANSVGVGCVTVLTFLVILALLLAVSGWVVMLCLGALWSWFGILAPLGYWASTGCALVLDVIAGFFRKR